MPDSAETGTRADALTFAMSDHNPQHQNDDVDTPTAAVMFIRRFGDYARFEATKLAYKAQGEGDADMFEAWAAVAMKIVELQPARRKRGQKLN